MNTNGQMDIEIAMEMRTSLQQMMREEDIKKKLDEEAQIKLNDAYDIAYGKPWERGYRPVVRMRGDMFGMSIGRF